jgi:hypothetical protein
MLGKDTHVIQAVPQGRYLYWKDAQTKIQVSSESACLDLIFKIAIRGGDYAHIYSSRAILSYTLEDAFLQNAKQLALQFNGDLAYFIQEERSLIRQLEPADAVPEGSRESPLHMAEELAFKELAWDRGAIHSDQCPIVPWAECMNRACRQFLSSPRFSANQNCRIGWRDDADLSQHLRQSLTLPENLTKLKTSWKAGSGHARYREPGVTTVFMLTESARTDHACAILGMEAQFTVISARSCRGLSA